MNNDTSLFEQRMQTAVSTTIENMSFLDAYIFDGEAPLQTDEPHYWTQLAVLKPVSGTINLQIPESLAAKMTTYMTGEHDRTATEQEILDALGELVNTLGGLYISSLAGSNTQLAFAVPKTGKGKLPQSTQVNKQIIFEIMEQSFVIILEGQSLIEASL